MKKTDNPITALQAQRDAAIEANAIAKYAARLKALESKAKALLLDIMKLTNPMYVRSAEGVVSETLAPKRKAVTASPSQVFDVHNTLVQLNGAAATIKNIRGATGLGPKVIASALRAMIKAGSVVEGPRGRFKAIAKPADNGAATGGSGDGELDSAHAPAR